MINQTLTNGNMQNLYSWQDQLARQLPPEWQPNAAYQITEVSSNLRDVHPQNSPLNITPENWYFVK